MPLKLLNAANDRAVKPKDVVAAKIYYSVGPERPTSMKGWTFYADTPRTRDTLTFPEDVLPGTTVWVTAQWMNRKMQTGQASEPVSAVINFCRALPQAA